MGRRRYAAKKTHHSGRPSHETEEGRKATAASAIDNSAWIDMYTVIVIHAANAFTEKSKLWRSIILRIVAAVANGETCEYISLVSSLFRVRRYV